MKTSKYNFLFECTDKYYGYNTLSTSIVELNKDIYEALNNNKLSLIKTDEINGLYDAGFIVEDDASEAEKYKYYYDTVRLNGTCGDLRIMFIPTYGCNLRCPYCYEGQNKSFESISDKSIDIISLFIRKEIQNSTVPIEKLTISLFGGEPTLYPQKIVKFCDSVEEICKDYNIKYDFDMTTNFTLVNDRLLSLIKKYEISTQISIDGAKEMHNTTRVTASGEGTYDLIINNLEKALSFGLRDLLTIRINTTAENLASCEGLFKELQKYSGDVYFGIINKYEGRNDDFAMSCMSGNSVVNAFSDRIFKLYKEAGLEIPVKFGKKNPCSMNSLNKYMIDNYLNVYKCDLLLNTTAYSVGHINENGEFEKNENYYKQMGFSPFNYEECKNCKLLPLCGANCPAEVILKEGYSDRTIPRGYCALNEEELKRYLISYVSLLEE